jgi:hypothetical protein
VNFPFRYSAAQGRDVCSRKQLPLKLAFGTTIHKSQGLTLDYVEVDCRDLFAAGHLSVAIGRARSSCGLRVRGFDSSRHIIPPPQCVIQFLQTPSAPLLSDLSCCKQKDFSEADIHIDKCDAEVIEEGEDHSVPSDEELVLMLAELYTENLLDEEGESEDINIPDDEQLVAMLAEMCDDNMEEGGVESNDGHNEQNDTNVQEQEKGGEKMEGTCQDDIIQAGVNEIISKIDFQHFAYNKKDIETLLNKLAMELDDSWPDKKVSTLTRFYAAYHEYMTYKFPDNVMMKRLLGEVEQADYFQIIDMATNLRTQFVTRKKEEKDSKKVSLSAEPCIKITKENHGVLRYLSGRAVAKVRKANLAYAKQNAGKKKLAPEVSKAMKTL